MKYKMKLESSEEIIVSTDTLLIDLDANKNPGLNRRKSISGQSQMSRTSRRSSRSKMTANMIGQQELMPYQKLIEDICPELNMIDNYLFQRVKKVNTFDLYIPDKFKKKEEKKNKTTRKDSDFSEMADEMDRAVMEKNSKDRGFESDGNMIEDQADDYGNELVIEYLTKTQSDNSLKGANFTNLLAHMTEYLHICLMGEKESSK